MRSEHEGRPRPPQGVADPLADGPGRTAGAVAGAERDGLVVPVARLTGLHDGRLEPRPGARLEERAVGRKMRGVGRDGQREDPKEKKPERPSNKP